MGLNVGVFLGIFKTSSFIALLVDPLLKGVATVCIHWCAKA